MDGYPEHLRPLERRPFEREPFSKWWARAKPHFATVPRNVARQWLWRHWGKSKYGWLPSSGARFALQLWQSSDVWFLAVPGVDSIDRWANWGDQLLQRANMSKDTRPPLYSIMKRRKQWPTPPIVLDNRRPIASPIDLPQAYVLVEGHQRMAIAKALARRRQLASDLAIWVLSYD